MSKRYTKKDVTDQLMHVLIVGLEVIQQSAKELRELNIPDEEWKAEEPSERVKKGREILGRMNLLNYMIEPSFGLARQLIPTARKLVDACELNYNQSLKDGVIKKCTCAACYERRNKD